MTAHGVAHRFDALGDILLTSLAQTCGIGRERGERRLDPCARSAARAARTLDLAFLGVDQAIDLFHQRLHLDRDIYGEVLALP